MFLRYFYHGLRGLRAFLWLASRKRLSNTVRATRWAAAPWITPRRCRRCLVTVLVVMVFAGCTNSSTQENTAPQNENTTPQNEEIELSVDPSADSSADLNAQDDNTQNGIIEYPTDQADHVIGKVEYETYPPTGGDHFDFWHNCLFYTQPLIDEAAVHSLEHGAVWVAYRPDVNPETLSLIRTRVEAETHLMASPYPGLESPLVLSAWERQLAVESWDDPLVEEFLNGYLGRSSTTAPEAGLSCAGAIGTSDNPSFNYDGLLAYALSLRVEGG